MPNLLPQSNINRRRHGFIIALTHIIFVALLFVLPEILMRYSSPWRHDGISWWVYGKSGVMIAVFYVNYAFLAEQMIVKRQQWIKFLLLNVVIIAAATLLMQYMSTVEMAARPPRRHHHGGERQFIASLSFMLRDGVMLAMVVALAVALKQSAHWFDLERRNQRLIAEQRESELAGLRGQLNPHFLFNTLNSIYALIEISPDEARRAVHELSQMLRYMVYENPESVDIGREVDFITNYIELMKLRMGRRPINFTVDNRADGVVTVPPLIFVTLVENAFKHGNTPNPDDAIDVAISVDDDSIRCTTRNRFDTAADQSDGGVGLANLSRRLELIYGRKASLTTSADDGIFTASLTIDRS